MSSIGLNSKLLIFIIYLFTSTAPTTLFASSNWQSNQHPSPEFVGALLTRVESNIHAQYPSARVKLSLLPLHPNIAKRISESCREVAFETTSQRFGKRIPVRVRCSQPLSWTFYASVEAKIEVQTVSSTQTLKAGIPLQKHHLAMQWKELSSLRGDVVTTIDDVIGLLPKRNLPAGRSLSLRHFAAPNAIQKGDQVAIEATIGRARVVTHGVALAAGQIGDQIQVENARSGKRFRMMVLAPGRVGASR